MDGVELGPTGVRGDRRFHLVDEAGELTTAKRVPRLLTVRPQVMDEHLRMLFADGTVVEGEIALGETVETTFYAGRTVTGRVVRGPWAAALSELAGKPLRLVRTEREGDGQDRGGKAGATLVSTASLDALAAAAGQDQVDGRRFRMTIGVDGVGPHEEDGWVGRRVRVGDAVVVARGNVGRCVVTTLEPDRGVRDFDTLGTIAEYRGEVPTTEPLPFGVWCEVVEPGARRGRRSGRARVAASVAPWRLQS